ncbi:Rid family hydrolase [Mycolicibacterium mengxianglii]|uniref:Rid family hydrolase n=1 Tax=Mycolicibacterium mengxianglii TaxID=2736649 RepID=UPI0018D18CB6|nr:Rid family hydrolase [Mycolicibacterium mengxianglii]
MSYRSSSSHSVEAILDERGLVSDGLVFVSGLTAADAESGIPPQAAVSGEFPYYGADIQKQTTYVLEKLSRVLSTRGCRLEDVVKTQVFLTDCRLFDAFDQIWKKFFPVPPPRTTVGVGSGAMAVPGTLVAVDAIAALPDVVGIRQIDSPRIPKPLANYTPCVGAGDWLFLAGQLPTEFGDTGLSPGAAVNPRFPHHVSSLIAQARFTIGVCQILLEDAGSDWDHTVRVHVFLKNMSEAPLFEALWNDKFDGNPPPYLIIGVDELLTGGAEIEIDVIAVRAGVPKHAATTADRSPDQVGISTAGLAATTFAVARVDVDDAGYRPFAVERALRAAFDSAGAQVGANARPVKVHAFLPRPADVFGLGRALPEGVAETAAISTSPSVDASSISLEVVYRTGV